jgi:hypothetical protein
MTKNFHAQKKPDRKEAQGKPTLIRQILMILFVLGILWMAGRGILYFFNFVLSRL